MEVWVAEVDGRLAKDKVHQFLAFEAEIEKEGPCANFHSVRGKLENYFFSHL